MELMQCPFNVVNSLFYVFKENGGTPPLLGCPVPDPLLGLNEGRGRGGDHGRRTGKEHSGGAWTEGRRRDEREVDQGRWRKTKIVRDEERGRRTKMEKGGSQCRRSEGQKMEGKGEMKER